MDRPCFGEFLAGAKGIEPLSAVLETDILPLNYAPVLVAIAPDFYVPRTPTADARVAHLYEKASGKTEILYVFNRVGASKI